MPIQYRYGEGEVKALAEKAGKAQAAQVQLEQRFRKDMAMMDYKFKLAGEQRARAWELEKMEIASRNDFQQQETDRVARQQQWTLIKKQIEETDTITDEQKKQALYDNYMKIYGGVVPKRDVTSEALSKLFGNKEEPAGSPQTSAENQQSTMPDYQIQASFNAGEGTKYLVQTPEGEKYLNPNDKVTVKDKNNNVGIASLFEVKANPDAFEILGIGDDVAAKFVQAPEGGLRQLMDDLEVSFTRQASPAYPDEVGAYRDIRQKQALRKNLGWQPTAIDTMWGQ